MNTTKISKRSCVKLLTPAEAEELYAKIERDRILRKQEIEQEFEELEMRYERVEADKNAFCNDINTFIDSHKYITLNTFLKKYVRPYVRKYCSEADVRFGSITKVEDASKKNVICIKNIGVLDADWNADEAWNIGKGLKLVLPNKSLYSKIIDNETAIELSYNADEDKYEITYIGYVPNIDDDLPYVGIDDEDEEV